MKSRGGIMTARDRWLAAVTLASLCVAASPGVAQETEPPRDSVQSQEAPPPSDPVLTLDRARELAVESNPQYRRALNDLTLQGPADLQNWGRWLPALSLGAGTSQSFVRQEVGTDDFGNPVPNPDAVTRWNSFADQSLSLSFDLFNGQNFYRFSETNAQVDVRMRTADATMVRLLAEVDRQFYAAQGRAELVIIEEEILEGRRTDLDATERLFGLAEKTRADVLAAELNVRQQEKALQDARSEFEKARLALKTALGRPDFGDFEIEPASTEVFDPARLSPERLVQSALQGNPAVLQERAAVDASRATLSAARAARWPVVRVSGSLGRAEFGPDQTALFDLSPTARSSGALGLYIDLPIFNQFQTSFSIAEARVGLDNARESVRERELEVEQAVREKLIELETAYLNYGLEEASLSLAEERLALTREQYRLATISFTDLQLAVTDAAEARRALVAARYEFLAARIALEEAVGRRLGDLPEN